MRLSFHFWQHHATRSGVSRLVLAAYREQARPSCVSRRAYLGPHHAIRHVARTAGMNDAHLGRILAGERKASPAVLVSLLTAIGRRRAVGPVAECRPNAVRRGLHEDGHRGPSRVEHGLSAFGPIARRPDISSRTGAGDLAHGQALGAGANRMCPDAGLLASVRRETTGKQASPRRWKAMQKRNVVSEAGHARDSTNSRTGNLMARRHL